MLPNAPDAYSSQFAELNGLLSQIREVGGALIERVHRRKNGSTFPVEISLKFIQVDKNSYLVGVTRDITERKRTERVKDEFISTVNHELRTPLTSISASLKLVTAGVAGAGQHRCAW